MNKAKKIIAFMISAAMLLSAAGCSDGGQESSSEKENPESSITDTSNASVNSDESASESSAEQVVIPEHHHEQTAKPVYDPDASCSIYIYMCGSNLESKSGLAGKDIDELLKADIPDKVNVVIETGGTAKWRSHDIANDKLQRYIVKDHTLTLVDELENQSMGDANTFVDFMSWGREKYPAQRDLLVVWDHGADATQGVCFDENYGFDGLEQADFTNYMKKRSSENTNAPKKLDMIIFDTCFMGSIETANWMQDYAHYMIASEVIVPGGGLDYTVIASEFAGNDDETFGKLVCDSFMEQCKKKGQDKDAELSFYDLSHTDEVLNQLEILFADTVSGLEKRDNAVEESEYSDSWLYRFVADNNTTLKNGTENNVVDVIRFSESIKSYDLDIMDDLNTAVGSLVPYHVGDVTIQPFPDLDPDYYKNLCTGVSLYYPLDSDKSEVKEYLAICPIEKYAEFLDALYVQIPDVQMKFADKGSVNADGLFQIQLTGDSAANLKEVGFKVWKQRKNDNSYFLIGTQTINMSNAENLTFTVPFTGEWYYLGGQRLTTNGSSENDGFNNMVAPILLNGESTAYNFSFSYSSDGKITFYKGTVGSLYDENGLIQRDVQFETLKKGDVVEVISENTYDETEPFTVESDDITAEAKMLEAGIYRIQIIAVDFNDNYISSDYGLYQVSEKGAKTLGVKKSE